VGALLVWFLGGGLTVLFSVDHVCHDLFSLYRHRQYSEHLECIQCDDDLEFVARPFKDAASFHRLND